MLEIHKRGLSAAPTPAQQAKAISGHNLKTVSALTGVSPQTLSNWAKNKPKCFYAILVGCKQLDIVGGVTPIGVYERNWGGKTVVWNDNAKAAVEAYDEWLDEGTRYTSRNAILDFMDSVT